MRILFILNGVNSRDGRPGVSGGDMRLIQIARRFVADDIHIMSSRAGIDLCRRLGLTATFHELPSSSAESLTDAFLRSLRSLLRTPPVIPDVVYSSCEHLYDVFPALALKIRNRVRWVAAVHWVEDPPWKNPRGGTAAHRLYAYHFNRVLSTALIRRFADTVLAVSQTTRDKLIDKKRFGSDLVHAVDCGVDLSEIESLAQPDAVKHYDAVFLKRLNPGKGVFDLVDIWKRVVEGKPAAKLLVIGDGPDSVVSAMKKRCIDFGLQDNVHFKGVVYDAVEKYHLLNSARLFILPSHEENWALVIGEALALGMPVLCYDLREIRPIWGDQVRWIPFGDVDAFASAILNYEGDVKTRSEKNLFMKDYDWDRIARHERNLIHSVVG